MGLKKKRGGGGGGGGGGIRGGWGFKKRVIGDKGKF